MKQKYVATKGNSVKLLRLTPEQVWYLQDRGFTIKAL